MEKELKEILKSEDPLYKWAKKITISHQRCSASFLQRKLRIGYIRAAKLVDKLEEDKIVGKFCSNKRREVLIKNTQD